MDPGNQSNHLLLKTDTLIEKEEPNSPHMLREDSEFLAKGGSKKVLEEAATADLEIREINKLTAEVIRTPLKVLKKVEKCKQVAEAIKEEAGAPLLPVAKKARHDSQCPSELGAENLNPRTAKGKASSRKVPVSRSRPPPSARVKRLSKRSSRSKFITPATGRFVDFCAPGGTSMVTPKFDSSVFKTPGLRTPKVNERVYTISANGSPLADSSDAFITLPVGGGESIRLTASDLTKNNLLHLNPQAQGVMKQLSARLAQACSARTLR
ncbi:PREDICTED: borealin [Chaetura pelagica]|uniref:borealin n=1 Tax=Chaetura pelagica TaxID=8897 RepID=UPI000523281E|nr:PREDICTED: borealin [Chaetura pelagica]